MNRENIDQIAPPFRRTELFERPSGDEQRLVLAAEARHRQRLLDGEMPRLEDLAQEWIELLRASMQKAADHDTAATLAARRASSTDSTEEARA